MVCPRCSLNISKSTLVCARCGELTPRPVGAPFETRPPNDGPRFAPLLAREIGLDRRGRGVRNLAPAAPLRVRPAPAQWSRSVREPAPRFQPRVVTPQALAAGAVALQSALHQARTEPVWHTPPEDALVPATPIAQVFGAAGAPGAEVAQTAENAAVSAPGLHRLAAGLIDLAVVAAVVALAALLGALAFGLEQLAPLVERGFDDVVDGLLIARGLGLHAAALAALVAFAYATLGHALAGRTLGKQLLGLRVQGRDGGLPSFSDAAFRSFASALSVALGGVGLAFAIFDPRGLALHDRLVGTRVVRAE